MQPVLFLSFAIFKTEGTLAKEIRIHSFIQYWPFYIQVLNVQNEPRLDSLLRFRTAFRSCPLFH